MARPGTFPKGVSGNPSGTPRPKAITELARRYTPDIIRALVEVARLPAREHAAAKVAAARELRIIGYPGLEKQGLLDGLASPAQLHLLAVQTIHAVLPNPHLTGEPAEEGPEIDAEDWTSTPGLLPEPDDALPDEALPLWDAYRARKRAEIPDSDHAGELATADLGDSGDFPPNEGDSGPETGDSGVFWQVGVTEGGDDGENGA